LYKCSGTSSPPGVQKRRIKLRVFLRRREEKGLQASWYRGRPVPCDQEEKGTKYEYGKRGEGIGRMGKTGELLAFPPVNLGVKKKGKL